MANQRSYEDRPVYVTTEPSSPKGALVTTRKASEEGSVTDQVSSDTQQIAVTVEPSFTGPTSEVEARSSDQRSNDYQKSLVTEERASTKPEAITKECPDTLLGDDDWDAYVALDVHPTNETQWSLDDLAPGVSDVDVAQKHDLDVQTSGDTQSQSDVQTSDLDDVHTSTVDHRTCDVVEVHSANDSQAGSDLGDVQAANGDQSLVDDVEAQTASEHHLQADLDDVADSPNLAPRLQTGGGESETLGPPDDQVAVDHQLVDDVWWAELLVVSDTLDKLEATRIDLENTYRALTTAPLVGERGGRFGKGLDPTDPAAVFLAARLDEVKFSEATTAKTLVKHMRTHEPFSTWQRATPGIGERQLARFLAVVGDPARLPDGSPRSLAQLRSYCGRSVVIHSSFDNHSCGGDDRSPKSGADQDNGESLDSIVGTAPRPIKGHKLTYNPQARSRLYVLAESCIKQTGVPDKNGKSRARSPLRDVYEEGRERYRDAVHRVECRNTRRPPQRSNGCGTTEHPEWGAPDSPLRDGHQHMRAMVLVEREILRQLHAVGTASQSVI